MVLSVDPETMYSKLNCTHRTLSVWSLEQSMEFDDEHRVIRTPEFANISHWLDSRLSPNDHDCRWHRYHPEPSECDTVDAFDKRKEDERRTTRQRTVSVWPSRVNLQAHFDQVWLMEILQTCDEHWRSSPMIVLANRAYFDAAIIGTAD